MQQRVDAKAWREEFRDELVSNILPFWRTVPMDRANGGLHGAVTNELAIDDGVPRSAVLATRFLWTFAAARRQLGDSAYEETARWAYRNLVEHFWDPVHDGLYWFVDGSGVPISDRKQHYAQAFGIYALSEYHRAIGDPESLNRAQRLFMLLEKHGHDDVDLGYFEGSTREWQPLRDARLSDRDMEAPKSMNTMLHLLEAYTNLFAAQSEPRLRARLIELIELFVDRILDRATGHLSLFFDGSWRSLMPGVSFGHDIEASWLLVEAAEAVEEPALEERARSAALRIVDAVLRDGRDRDGSLFTEAGADGVSDLGKDWWPQTEAIVGFYNAHQLTGDVRFSDAAKACWRYVKQSFVDRRNGDWFKRIGPDGWPDPERYKAGPWECPYHHSRAALEMIRRLDGGGA